MGGDDGGVIRQGDVDGSSDDIFVNMRGGGVSYRNIIAGISHIGN